VEARQDNLRPRLTVRLAAGNRLQALVGDRKGQHSMKLTMQNKGWTRISWPCLTDSKGQRWLMGVPSSSAVP
jgi:hypothetical protein